jgi:hypothetical protein
MQFKVYKEGKFRCYFPESTAKLCHKIKKSVGKCAVKTSICANPIPYIRKVSGFQRFKVSEFKGSRVQRFSLSLSLPHSPHPGLL